MHAEASGGEGEMSLRVEGDSPHRRLRFVAERIALVVFEIHLAPQLAFRPKARFSLRVRIDVLSAHSLAIDVDSDKVSVIDRDKCRNGPRRASASMFGMIPCSIRIHACPVPSMTRLLGARSCFLSRKDQRGIRPSPRHAVDE
jgi:hypothetical protein